MTDLWTARSLGLVTMKLNQVTSFSSPKVIQKLVKTKLKALNKPAADVRCSWDDAIILNHALDNLSEPEHYNSIGGLIRFVLQQADDHKIRSTPLWNLPTAFNAQKQRTMGWKSDVPLRDAIVARGRELIRDGVPLEDIYDQIGRALRVSNEEVEPYRGEISAIDLSALATVSFDQIDVRKQQTLPSLIETALRPISISGAQRPQVRTLEEVAEALKWGETLIPADFDIPATETWFGTVDLKRLNNLNDYLDLPRSYLALTTDLWTAHALGLVRLELKHANSFNRPNVIKELVKTELKALNKPATDIRCSWHDAIVLNHAVDSLIEPEHYGSIGGLLRFDAGIFDDTCSPALAIGTDSRI